MGIIIEFLPSQGLYSTAVDERYDEVMKAVDRVMAESVIEGKLPRSQQFLIGALLRDRREKKP